jgi:hypothetical protein
VRFRCTSANPEPARRAQPGTARRGDAGTRADLGDDLAVLGLVDGDEPHAAEERLGAALAGLVDDVDAIHAARARLVEQLLHGEAADAAALVVGVDVDPPEHGAEVILLGLLIEVRAHEPDDLVAVEHHALPGGGRIATAGDRVAGRGENCSCPGLRDRVLTATIVAADSSTRRSSVMSPG